ncbi:MAG: glucoamylase family protein, partial [Geminicoccaceae bacterium]
MSQAERSAPKTRAEKLDDDALLDLVQRQTFRYFWDFAHPVSGLARERSNVRPDYGLETVTAGGSGFGVMAILVAAERGWISR